ncbi:hypothetical protein B0H10DRAFT_2296999 [Mycena sp. CBHHK59/15]|nr:hypothetical protein B0H10DRAFT_2296999 [Mycena sp. CBHHK59/15]
MLAGLDVQPDLQNSKIIELAIWFTTACMTLSKAVPGTNGEHSSMGGICRLDPVTSFVFSVVSEKFCNSPYRGDDIAPSTEGTPGPLTASDAAAFLDLDMAILADPPEAYEKYAQDIRKEYSHFPSDVYRTGRSKVLESFLSRERIYLGSGKEAMEARARANGDMWFTHAVPSLVIEHQLERAEARVCNGAKLGGFQIQSWLRSDSGATVYVGDSRRSLSLTTLTPSTTMTRNLKFTKLDVFTATPYLGNPLAIVHVPSTVKLTQAEKQLIAREFNLSETVFHHEQTSVDPNTPVVIDIFTTEEELPFAGHPTVGSGFYLLSRVPQLDAVTLRTRAGDIPVVRDAGRVRLQVPIDFKPQLVAADYVNGHGGAEAVVSVVKGMTFVLLALASEDALARLQPYPTRLVIPTRKPCSARGATASRACTRSASAGTGRAHADVRRVVEDPATGSAASTLGGWLALQRGAGSHTIEIVQGVEMERRSEIKLVVDVGADNAIKSIAWRAQRSRSWRAKWKSEFSGRNMSTCVYYSQAATGKRNIHLSEMTVYSSRQGLASED